MRKTPLKKRPARTTKPRTNVDPTRMALAALERIRTIVVQSGHEDRLGQPLTMKDLAAQAHLLGTELPPSYVAAMRVVSQIGEPEVFLSAQEMADEASVITALYGEEAKRYAPFAKTESKLICFDAGTGRRAVTAVKHQGELAIVEWIEGAATSVAAHFGDWLDMVADAREETMESAAQIPQRLKRLLYELGFRFEYPVIGKVETGDLEAIRELIGPELEAEARGEVDRLFDSSGKAALTLNVDEFTLTVTLRTGVVVFEAEDVFRWLRYFRDENFFGDVPREPSHPDNVRDLRRAPREQALVLRGVMHMALMPASKHVFRAASGASASDFYLLGRTVNERSTVSRPLSDERAPSLVLHVVEGVVATSHGFDDPLDDLYVARDGTLWGLSTTGNSAIRISGGRVMTFPLERVAHGRPRWYGIGGDGDRVLVWGSGSLLEFDGRTFVPFEPDAMLDETESVVALAAHGLRISMLVCGDRMGAVARFDSVSWQPIDEDQVIEANLVDLDVWRGASYVLDRDAGVWQVGSGPPRSVPLPLRHQAFVSEHGTPRNITSVRAHDTGLLLASHGGVVVTGAGDPVFFDAPAGREGVRLVRVGGTRGPSEADDARDVGIVALSGPNAWIWKDGEFTVLDMREH